MKSQRQAAWRPPRPQSVPTAGWVSVTAPGAAPGDGPRGCSRGLPGGSDVVRTTALRHSRRVFSLLGARRW